MPLPPRPPKGTRWGGRQKGTPNRFSVEMRTVFERTFRALQKVRRVRDPKTGQLSAAVALKDWAQENPTEFYRMLTRLIPVQQQLTGPDGGAVPVTGQIVLYIPDNARARPDTPVPPQPPQPPAGAAVQVTVTAAAPPAPRIPKRREAK